MAEAHESEERQSSSMSGSDGNESGDFECNICFELAQDPVITQCGHLYCWPCLYRWLRGHSQSHECPVCKALIVEEKLIPLYGRGKTSTDPRTKPIPGFEIPNRPSGQRPETAPPPPENTNFPNFVSGLMGYIPMASATFNNIGVSAGFGGLFTPFFSVQFQGFNARGYGGSPGYNYGSFRGRGTNQVTSPDDENLKKILIFVVVLVIITFLTI